MSDVIYEDIDLTTLEGRVNQLDGQNLPAGSVSTVAALQRQINGLKTTINNLTVTLEQQLQTLSKAVQNLTTEVNTLTGSN